jgi:hypothetical protein
MISGKIFEVFFYILFQMITSTNGSMELIIAEPLFLPSLLKSHHYYHTDYSLREAECNRSENPNYAVKLRNRSMDIHSQQPTPLSKTGSLTIDESPPVRIKY